MNQHICQVCKKNVATVHELIVATKEEKHLCEQCYQKINLEQASQVIPMEALKKLFLQGQTPGSVPPVQKETRCSSCGMTISEFRRLGRFGCENCYGTFRKQLTGLLESVHGETRHVGMRPEPGQEDLPSPGRERLRREKLEQELKRAVAAEKYEEAARLRDELRRLAEEEGEGEGAQP